MANLPAKTRSALFGALAGCGPVLVRGNWLASLR